jgi:hypothetical protein
LVAFALSVLGLFALLVANPASGGTDEVAGATCLLCTGSKSVKCPTCAGKGRATSSCESCAGRGRGMCAHRFDTEAELPKPRSAHGLDHVGTMRPCPNPKCRKGRVTWDDFKEYTCRLCGGDATVACGECRRAQLPCGVCRGTTNVEGPCLDCAATGKLPCLLCAPKGAVCSACKGEGATACPRCKGESEVRQPCPKCDGLGERFCDRCRGLGKLWCTSCAATGRNRGKYKDETTAYSVKCSSCDGKGTHECDDHERLVHCPLCDGAKQASFTCPECSKSNRVPCRSCGAWGCRALEAQAGALASGAAAWGPSAEAAFGLYTRANERAAASERAVSGITPAARRQRVQFHAAVVRCTEALAKLGQLRDAAKPK